VTKMTFGTWKAIGDRQLRFRSLLLERMRQWPTERIAACESMETLRRVVALADRVERHQARLERHFERLVLLVDSPSRGVH
jgi:hypothetical protein